MKRKQFIVLLLAVIVTFFNVIPVQANGSVSVGDTFTVDSITYRVTSVTGTMIAEPISTPMSKTEINIQGTVSYNSALFYVTTIPNGAFYGNYKATKITISEGIKTVGSTAFQGCNAVKEISLPSTLETFTTMGFANLETISVASGSASFQVKDGVLFNGNGSKLLLYPSAKSGTSYTVPNGTSTIAESAFYQNKYLKTISFSNSVTTIEDYALCQLNSLTAITFGSNISSIGKHNLRSCPELESVTLKNSGKIGDYTIYDCESLETITVDGAMSGYGVYAFYNLPKLKSYSVKNSSYYTAKEGVLYSSNQLLRYPSGKTNTQYIIPEGTTKIAGLAFNYMQHTKEIVLNPGVTVDLLAFHYPNKNAPINIYFRDKDSVKLSTSNSGVFVGLTSGSHIYLPTTAALNSFNKYSNSINPSGSVTVEVKTIPCTSVTLSASKKELDINETFALKTSLNPFYTTDSVTWSASNKDIAKVSSDGVVTAVGTGKCKITVTAGSGVSDSCTITVTKTVKDTASDEKNGTSSSSGKEDSKTNSDEKNTDSNKKSDSSSSNKKAENKVTEKEDKEDGKNIFQEAWETITGQSNEDIREDVRTEQSGSSSSSSVKTYSLEPVIIGLAAVVILLAVLFVLIWKFVIKKKRSKIQQQTITEMSDETKE